MNEPSGYPPRINHAVNIKALPLEPEEAFVYSRVDGRSQSKDIALTTGLPVERVERALRRLGELGALECIVVASLSASSDADSTFVGLPDIDLSEAEQRAVHRLWQTLPNLDHYELLGLQRSATRSQVKEAYFAKVAAFHPDKHFGKRLGRYKEMLEVVFQRLTLANDTLGRSSRREEYDATLPPPRPTSLNVAATSEHPHTSLRPATNSLPRASSASLPPPPSAPPVAPTLIPRHPPVPTIGAAPSPSMPPDNPLPSTQAASPAPSVRPGVVIPSVPPGALISGLSKPAAGKSVPPVSDEQRRQIAAHSITRGLRHLGTKGVDSLRPKLSPKPEAPTPSSPPSGRSQMLEQAQVAASRADWERAGALFAKLGGEQKDAHLLSRAAECFAQATGQSNADVLRKAVECARQAVSLAPNNVHFRLGLSRLYADAGLMKSALGEAERAQELSPADKRVQSWVQHLRQRDAGALG